MANSAASEDGQALVAETGPVVGERAPDFDLTSTEDCVLTLRDAVGRAAALLYFFPNPEAATVRADLQVLADLSHRLPGPLRILAISPTPIPRLKELQRELHLPFPLLRDDRALAAGYGFDPETDGTLLALVDRRQRLAWLGTADTSVASRTEELQGVLRRLEPPTALLPRRLVNRLIARFGRSAGW